jgi:hypothetical protein
MQSAGFDALTFSSATDFLETVNSSPCLGIQARGELHLAEAGLQVLRNDLVPRRLSIEGR